MLSTRMAVAGIGALVLSAVIVHADSPEALTQACVMLTRFAITVGAAMLSWQAGLFTHERLGTFMTGGHETFSPALLLHVLMDMALFAGLQMGVGSLLRYLSTTDLPIPSLAVAGSFAIFSVARAIGRENLNMLIDMPRQLLNELGEPALAEAPRLLVAVPEQHQTPYPSSTPAASAA